VHFVAYDRLGDTPNVIVDGAASPSTVLSLSHWPKSGSPAWAKADLSAEMAFRYLDEPGRHVDVDAVSNNHFDQDGLVSVFALCEPDAAQSRRDRLIDLAAAGDFGTYRYRDAARAAMAIAAYDDDEQSPMADEFAGLDYPARAALLYETFLPRVPELIDHVDRFRDVWAAEDAALTASEKAIAGGQVRIDELPELDLAIVDLPADAASERLHRFTVAINARVHPFAVANATQCFRLLYRRGRRYELQYRYESWVQMTTKRPAPRVDLTPLARHLDELEGAERWTFDGVGQLTPSLHLVDAGDSRVAPEEFLRLVTTALRAGPAAWDPYD
jgi:hypothetical protein